MNQMAQERHKPPDVTGLALITGDPTMRHFGPPTYEKKSSEIKTYRIPGKARHPAGHSDQQYSRTKPAK